MKKGTQNRPLRLRAVGKKIRDRSGTTMVELIVSFLLLAVFLTAVTMVISNALITYYSEKRMLSIYSVADTVLKEAKRDIRKMQGSGEASGGMKKKGYIKLRDAYGKTVTARTALLDDQGNPAEDGSGNPISAYQGAGIEFLKGSEKDGMLLEQIDAAGCQEHTAMIGEEGVLKKEDAIAAAILPDQLTKRYYLIPSGEETEALKGLFMDRIFGSSSLRATYHELDTDAPVVWDVENPLPQELYQGFKVRLSFAALPYADGEEEAISAVRITVAIYDPAKEVPSTDPEPVYKRSSMLSLENTVWYKKDDTTSFDTTY